MYRVIVMLLLVASCVSEPKNKQASSSDGDSLIAFIKTTVRPQLQSWQTGAAKRILDSLQPVVTTIDQYKLTCTWLTFKSSLSVLQGQLDSARYYIDRAMAIASKEDTAKRILLEVQIQYANTLNEQKSLGSALRYARAAYDLAKKVDTTLLPVICYRLYEMYRIIDDHPAMKKYLFEGLKYSDQTLFKIAFTNGIADYYDRVGQIDSAIVFFKTFEKDTSFSSPYFAAVRYNNLGTFLSKKGAYKEALPYQLKAMTINRETGQLSGWAFFSLAETYFGLEEYAHAKIYLDSAMNMAEAQNDRTLVTKLWEARAKMYKALQRHQYAYTALDSSFQSYHKEIDASIAVQAKELEAKYAGKAKDEAIQGLSFKNEMTQRIASQRMLIIISLFVVLILLGAVVTLWWRRRRLQMLIREAELRQQLLRSQIDPHFLFNSLEVLQSSMRQVELDKALNYLSSFSRLLRLIFKNAKDSLVSLKDEIDALSKYLQLQAINFDDKFEYSIQLDDGMMEDELQIPPMLIQPFVENAVLHGVSKVNYKGIINIKIGKQNSFLHCIVEDNGTGLKVRPPSNVTESTSTQIIRERLKILARQTRQPATLAIINKHEINEGTGVKVVLKIGLNSMGPDPK
jgi:tetratricopeptide (TPR) repeat protein